MTVSQSIARNLLAFAGRDYPEESYHIARAAIIDTIGVILAGSAHEGARIHRRTVLPLAGAGRSRVLGTDRRVDAPNAAFLNGAAAHMLDFDDSSPLVRGHPTASILPTILALADEHDRDGRVILQTFIAAFETSARVGEAVGAYQYTHGWHPTVTIGIFGAVAAAALLLGLTEAQTAAALGIATSFASGVKSNFGSMTKPLIVGHANRNAITAALLAKNGFSSGPAAFEHHHGYFNVFNNGPGNYDATPVSEDWSGPPKILDSERGILQKRYPCCHAIAAPLDGVLALREAGGLRPEDIVRIEIDVHPIRFPHINVPQPETPLAAKFSPHYSAARAIVAGKVVLDDYEDETVFQDPATRAVMARVQLGRHERDDAQGAVVRIETADGRHLRHEVEKLPRLRNDGPRPEPAVEVKFLDTAARAIGRDRAASLYGALVADRYLFEGA
ncbi:MAG: MmgE/PrpD family protein [Pseudochelatococcus sp.]|jgi:2-methylcitrate dehydratase PrpD|uniref:MmgE/PrpD family protein n=1 Tax=Pseudochelatococcus sp. TaxID=2020869 RepID=UPI003D8C7B5F